MTTTTLHESALSDLLENLVRGFLKDKLEFIMKEDIKNVLQVEHQPTEQKNYRNGYYERTLDTRYGRIDDLMVPRDRNNEFQTQLFEPY